MELKNIIYALVCLSFAVVIGGAIYEHIGVVPKWRLAPPVSLSMFQGKYGLDPSTFWKSIHPVTLILFIITLIIFWRTASKPYILIPLIGYILVLIITAIYFVPELLSITGTAFSDHADASLMQRARLWEILSLVRLAFLIILSIILFLGVNRVEVRPLLNP